MEQHTAEVGEKGQERQIGQDRMRLAQHGIQRRIGRQDRWQTDWAELTMG